MDILAEIILPVFGLVLLGFVAGKLGWIRDNAIEGLSVFVFNFAIPVMLFRNIAQAELTGHIPWDFLLSYYATTLLLFAGTLAVARLSGLNALSSAIFAMTGSYSNVVLLGIPLVVASLGEAALVPLFIIVSTHAAVMFMVTTLIAELARGDRENLRLLPWQTFQVLARNPIVIALICGLLVNLAGLTLPSLVDNVAGYLGGAALPCAVFSMGASISLYKVSGDVGRISILLICKNLVHPLMVWIAAAFVFQLPHPWTAVAVVLAGAPSGINAYLFAQRYQVVIPATATTVVLSTLLSVPVLSFILYMLQVR